jgi:RNA recognition motif-containing protein
MDSAFLKPVVPLLAGGRKRARSEDPPAPREAAAASPAPAAPPSIARAAGSRRALRGGGAPRAAASCDPRAGRTLFVGNLPTTTTRPALRRFVCAALPAPAAGGAPPVESVRFRSVPVAKVAVAPGSNFRSMIRAAVASGSFNEARDSMNAYVVLRDAADVAPALALNGALFGGRHLRVDAAARGVGGGGEGAAVGEGAAAGEGAVAAAGTAPGAGGAPRYDHKRTVFVGNLPFDAGEEAVRAAFERCGGGGAPVPVEAVRIVRDRATLMGKGFCFVLFKERAGVLDALGLHGAKVAALGGRPLRVVRCSADGKPLQGKAAPASGSGGAGKKRAGGGGGGAARPAARAPPPPSAPHMGARGVAFAAKPKAKLPQKGALVAAGKKKKWKGARAGAGGGARPAAAAASGAAAPHHKKARTIVEGWAAAASAPISRE